MPVSTVWRELRGLSNLNPVGSKKNKKNPDRAPKLVGFCHQFLSPHRQKHPTPPIAHQQPSSLPPTAMVTPTSESSTPASTLRLIDQLVTLSPTLSCPGAPRSDTMALADEILAEMFGGEADRDDHDGPVDVDVVAARMRSLASSKSHPSLQPIAEGGQHAPKSRRARAVAKVKAWVVSLHL
eukprot:TRINITY_DN157_c0_g1_i10.p1 TRINITY_DN157_c0_g1~~TRINITY_DN157_c0_g1_i10.p1  ORF type:complete len:182 (+),score=32.57 TRINITY_DN157_c0_g1_i10:309-854(+)